VRSAAIGTSTIQAESVSPIAVRIGDTFSYLASRLGDRQTPRSQPRTPLTSR
jgi:hypothetical protein